MRFVLVRHGTTVWNEQGKIQGITDTNLNARGIEEAKELAKKLTNLGISQLISSTLNRAMQTAALINVELGVPKETDIRLRECSFGKIEGLTIEKTKKQFKGILSDESLYSCKHYDYKPVGGEDSGDVMKRFIGVLEDCRKKFSEDDVILLVGHGWVFCTFLIALGDDNPKMQRGEYRVIEY